MIFNTHLGRYKKLYYSELFYNTTLDMFYSKHPTNHIVYEKGAEKRHQKNWTPFDFCPHCIFKNGYISTKATNNSSASVAFATTTTTTTTMSNQMNATLLFVYSMFPHIIVESYPTGAAGQRNAEKVFSSKLSKGARPDIPVLLSDPLLPLVSCHILYLGYKDIC